MHCASLSVVCTSASLLSSTALGGGVAQWVGPSTGNCDLASHWSPIGAPEGVSVSVSPRGGAQVTFNVFQRHLANAGLIVA